MGEAEDSIFESQLRRMRDDIQLRALASDGVFLYELELELASYSSFASSSCCCAFLPAPHLLSNADERPSTGLDHLDVVADYVLEAESAELGQLAVKPRVRRVGRDLVAGLQEDTTRVKGAAVQIDYRHTSLGVTID